MVQGGFRGAAGCFCYYEEENLPHHEDAKFRDFGNLQADGARLEKLY